MTKSTYTYWVIKLKHKLVKGHFAGNWWWGEENPKKLDGVALFRTRRQAREHMKGKQPFMGPAVKVQVTVEEIEK